MHICPNNLLLKDLKHFFLFTWIKLNFLHCKYLKWLQFNISICRIYILGSKKRLVRVLTHFISSQVRWFVNTCIRLSVCILELHVCRHHKSCCLLPPGALQVYVPPPISRVVQKHNLLCLQAALKQATLQSQLP